VWDAEAGKELGRFDGHSGTVYALAISDDGKRLLSASLDGTARLWDMRTGDELMQVGHDGPLYAVAFGPDGTVVTGGIDRSIRIWPAIGGEQIALIPGAPG
jgi:WD40 repeat protein